MQAEFERKDSGLPVYLGLFVDGRQCFGRAEEMYNLHENIFIS